MGQLFTEFKYQQMKVSSKVDYFPTHQFSSLYLPTKVISAKCSDFTVSYRSTYQLFHRLVPLHSSFHSPYSSL